MKDRTSYESQVLYVGPSYSGYSVGSHPSATISGFTPAQIERVQRLESSITLDKTVIYQGGSSSPLGNLVQTPPEVSLEFEYVLADGYNEKLLGLTLSDLDQPLISGLAQYDNHGDGEGSLSPFRGEQNFYILTKKRGDAVTTGDTPFFLQQNSGAGDSSVMGFGNGVIENYKVEASLTEIPRAIVLINANNVTFATGCSGIEMPTIVSGCAASGQDGKPRETVTMPAPQESSLEVDALRPSYINLAFGDNVLEGGGVIMPGNEVDEVYAACSINSFAINVDLPRRLSQRLGSAYPVSKAIEFPVNVTLECEAHTRDIASGNLIDALCSGKRNILIEMNSPNATGGTPSGNIKIGVSGAYLENYTYLHNLVGDEMVQLIFSAPMDSGVHQTGICMSGVANRLQETTYGISEEKLLAGEFPLR